jgi:hypothetical protein
MNKSILRHDPKPAALMDFLIALGQDVEITVRRTRQEHGQGSKVFLVALSIFGSGP